MFSSCVFGCKNSLTQKRYESFQRVGNFLRFNVSNEIMRFEYLWTKFVEFVKYGPGFTNEKCNGKTVIQ